MIENKVEGGFIASFKRGYNRIVKQTKEGDFTYHDYHESPPTNTFYWMTERLGHALALFSTPTFTPRYITYRFNQYFQNKSSKGN